MAVGMRHTTRVGWVDSVDGDLAEDLWKLYETAFREVNALAVQRHLMHRGEFDEVMADRRVRKYVAREDGDPGPAVGLATFTNHLDAVPLVSPAYFERRWPHLYAKRRIWYCGFVAVVPGARGMPTDAYPQLVSAMFTTAAEQHAMIVLDLCDHNSKGRGMERSIPLMLHRLDPDVATELLDRQSFWAYTPGGTR